MAHRAIGQSGNRPGRCHAVLVGLVGLALMVAMTAPGKAQPSRIESVSIVSESSDTVTFEIIYDYAGEQGDNVAMTAAIVRNGARPSFYENRPGTVRRGRHRTRVELSTLERAPDLFASNQVEFGMFVAGRAPFLSQTFAFAKTWSRPRTGLPAVPGVAAGSPIAGNIIAQLANPQVREFQAVQAAEPPGRLANLTGRPPVGGGVDGAPARRVLSDGSIELRYSDGTVRIRTNSSETVIHPDGSQQVFMFQNAQPPSPPSAPPDATHANWVTAELDSLLRVIGTLVGNDQASIDHYLAQEGAGLSPYVRINLRTRTIDMLVRP